MKCNNLPSVLPVKNKPDKLINKTYITNLDKSQKCLEAKFENGMLSLK